MSLLSNYISTASTIPAYLEYSWVTSPSATGQTITPSNLWVTLSCNTEVADTGNNGSINATNNRITLDTGTYYFEGYSQIRCAGNTTGSLIMGLYNITDSNWITQSYSCGNAHGSREGRARANMTGQFVITSQTVFELKGRVAGGADNFIIDNGIVGETLSNSTQFTNADKDYRTTIKLWKLS